jgi:uncharacterized SAM-binding protein YcdF (DUF218 family)
MTKQFNGAMSLFWLKKFISFWLMPLPFCLTLLAVGTCYLFSPRLSRLGRRLVTMGTLLLLLFGNKAVSTALVQPLERRYPPVPEFGEGAPIPPRLAGCRYVVVLGGGHGDVAGFSATNKLSSSALARLVEGVRLARALPQAQLIMSGPAAPGYPSHAAVLAEAAVSLGLDRTRIILIDTAHDTEDESQRVKAIVGTAHIALVTSAWHMPRAAALFRKAGVATVPCPADFSARSNAYFNWADLAWDAESLDRSTYAVRENVGYLWVWLRGKV